MFSPPTTTTTFSSTWSTATADQSSFSEDTNYSDDHHAQTTCLNSAYFMKQASNPKLKQQQNTLQFDILVLSGEQGGVGQSSLIYRFVTSEYKEHLSHCSSTIYTKEIQLNVNNNSNSPINILEDVTSHQPLPSTTSMIATDENNCSEIMTFQDKSQNHEIAAKVEETSNAPKTHPINVILNIEDYIPRYITDLENTDDRQSDCDAQFDETYFVECQKRQERHYSKMDAFIICFDAQQEDFIDFVYNELNTIKKACGGEDSSLYQSKVIVLALTKQDDTTSAITEIANTTTTTIASSLTSPLFHSNLQQQTLDDSVGVRNETRNSSLANDSLRTSSSQPLIQLLVSDTHLPLFRVSAKDNINVTELFNHVARQVFEFKWKHQLIPTSFFSNEKEENEDVQDIDHPQDQTPPFMLPFKPNMMSTSNAMASASARTVPPNYQQQDGDREDSLHVDTHSLRKRRHSYDQSIHKTKCLLQ
ncbi:hypothetical protein C9374_014569 [Naegleria lovaniensis]|uniref:Uncharacterized protein n=1 Tax=Naegleria lovaniensis TaxID=51637 RepID=A0AA88KPJ1_NAELO|nr:uncharacterized protein C9374_014569 [Naegleria lovaniensis]KAG2389169.1 hypothetical protein C9374_014569 [Naegleria lovaniensis]